MAKSKLQLMGFRLQDQKRSRLSLMETSPRRFLLKRRWKCCRNHKTRRWLYHCFHKSFEVPILPLVDILIRYLLIGQLPVWNLCYFLLIILGMLWIFSLQSTVGPKLDIMSAKDYCIGIYFALWCHRYSSVIHYSLCVWMLNTMRYYALLLHISSGMFCFHASRGVSPISILIGSSVMYSAMPWASCIRLCLYSEYLMVIHISCQVQQSVTTEAGFSSHDKELSMICDLLNSLLSINVWKEYLRFSCSFMGVRNVSAWLQPTDLLASVLIFQLLKTFTFICFLILKTKTSLSVVFSKTSVLCEFRLCIRGISEFACEIFLFFFLLEIKIQLEVLNLLVDWNLQELKYFEILESELQCYAVILLNKDFCTYIIYLIHTCMTFGL